MFEAFTKYLPVAATEAAQSWDLLFWFLFIVCVAFFLVVMVPLVVFMFQYRKSNVKKPTYIDHNQTLEVVWTAIPFFVLMAIFAWGWIVYKELQYSAPKDAMEVRVIATGAWKWKFQYEDGWIENDDLIVPAGQAISLVLTAEPGTKGQPGSSSMIHSFFVPNFRLKKDCVPGIYNTAWFQTKEVGKHIFFCTEYCGSQHSQMYGRVIVLDEEAWQLWKWRRAEDKEIKEKLAAEIPWIGVGAMAARYQDPLASNTAIETKVAVNSYSDPHENLVESGKKLAMSMGCNACHSADGATRLGPSYRGIYKSERVLADGTKVIADENYLRESIENPQAKIVAGYEHVVMPPYPGHLSETELSALIAYVKSAQ